MKTYFISGLGADKRAFDKIELPAGYEAVYLDWIPPLPEEQLEQYAVRFAQKIDASVPFMLVGLSFGGMLAVEISKIKPPRHLVLIATAATRNELPLPYRIAGSLKLDKLLPYKRLTKKPGRFINWLFGPLDEESKEILHSFIKNTDPAFLKWALGQIARWRNTQHPANLLQIHGSKDKLFPAQFSKATFEMTGGGHFCLFSHCRVINMLLANQLR